MKVKYLVFLISIGIGAVGIYKNSVRPEVLRTLFPEKIWPHRVNSISKLKETAEIFSGVEFDVVWEDNYFDVNHPPVESIQLDLNEYLEHLPSLKKYGLWIDYKNLKAENALQSAQRLDSLIEGRNLKKDRIYVESRNPSYLKPFLERGYNISYYLPTGLTQINQQDSIIKIVDRINVELNKNPDLYISAPFSEYNFMREHFPERKKLLWHLNDLFGPMNKWNIYRALLDKKVEVVLLNYNAKTGNR